MEEKDWCQMKFPKAKALILNFSATEYFLPPFMESMPELKVLIIVNHHFKRATLKGISVFSSLTQLKVVRLERVKVPPLQEYCQSWQKLEKLSFTLCEGFGDVGLDWYFPSLVEFAIDHCSGLKELPASVCNMASLERLFVTNCPDLLKLPDDIGNLSSLQMLRFYACPIIEELPCSFCNLGQLLFLDISVCAFIKQLPDMCAFIKQLPDILDQLSNLEEIHMWDSSGVNIPIFVSDLKPLMRVSDLKPLKRVSGLKLPKSVTGMRSLKRFMLGDEGIGKQWTKIKLDLIKSLEVEIREEHFSLDWLD